MNKINNGVRFTMDVNDPEKTLDSFHADMESQLLTLSKRFDKRIADLDLGHPAPDLFHGYTPWEIERVLVPVHALIKDADTMSLMLRVEGAWLLNQFAGRLSADALQEHAEDMSSIDSFRGFYIHLVSRNCIMALNRELQVSGAPEVDPAQYDPMTPAGIGVRYFGMPVLDPSDKGDAVAEKVKAFIDDMGCLTSRIFSSHVLKSKFEGTHNPPLPLPALPAATMIHKNDPKAPFKYDTANPEETFEKFFHDVDKKMTSYEVRLEDNIKKFNLDRDPDQLFKGFSPFQLEKLVCPVYKLFSRMSLLVKVWREEAKYIAADLNIATMPQEIVDRQKALLDRLNKFEERYVERIGKNLQRALYREMQVKMNPPKTTVSVRYPHDLSLKYFGSIAVNPGDPNDKASEEIIALLRDLGKVCEAEVNAEDLVQGFCALGNH